jgi:hypothetical protein
MRQRKVKRGDTVYEMRAKKIADAPAVYVRNPVHESSP